MFMTISHNAICCQAELTRCAQCKAVSVDNVYYLQYCKDSLAVRWSGSLQMQTADKKLVSAFPPLKVQQGQSLVLLAHES